METTMRMLAAASLLAGLGAPTAAITQAMPAPAYLAAAGAGDLFERESGKLMTASRVPAVHDFATMTMRDHARSVVELTAAARRARLAPGMPRLDRRKARHLAALRAARGHDRDRLYIDQQRAAQRDALALHRRYARDGQVASLRVAATKVVPMIERHLVLLEVVQRRLALFDGR